MATRSGPIGLSSKPRDNGVQQKMRRTTLRRRLVLLAFLGLVAGCGGTSQGKVSGRVLLAGAPLPGGKLMFRPADGRFNLVTVVLDESGTFSVELPAGEVMVAVANRDLEPR